MRLKLKTEKQDYFLQKDLVSSHTNLATLLVVIEDLANIPSESIKSLLVGYPPKQIKTEKSNQKTTLAGLGIKSGDTLRVRKNSQSNLHVPKESSPVRKRSSDKDYKPSSPNVNKVSARTTPTRLTSKRAALDNIQNVVQGQARRYEVPSDNTCLFYSIDFVLNDGIVINDRARNLRSLVANKVLTNTTNLDTFFGELTLGQSIDDYCAWIQSDGSWGGATELAILAKHFKICICAVDIKTLRIDRYCSEYSSKSSFILYDGIHYDPMYMDYNNQTKVVFDLNDTKQDPTGEMVQLASILQAARQYTDAGSMKLMCGNCGARFPGQTQALAHAQTTGHSNFQET